VVVTPGGIFAGFMLYFLPQYKQVIFFVPVVCWTFFAGSGFVVAAAWSFSEIL
jgi:hypothetical protein